MNDDFVKHSQLTSILQVQDKLIGRFEKGLDRMEESVDKQSEVTNQIKLRLQNCEHTSDEALAIAKLATIDIQKIKSKEIPWGHIGTVLGTIIATATILKLLGWL